MPAVEASRRIYQRMLTYALNKIIKTLQIAVFLSLGPKHPYGRCPLRVRPTIQLRRCPPPSRPALLSHAAVECLVRKWHCFCRSAHKLGIQSQLRCLASCALQHARRRIAQNDFELVPAPGECGKFAPVPAPTSSTRPCASAISSRRRGPKTSR